MRVAAGGGQIVGAVAVALEMQQAVANLDRHAVQTDGRVDSAVVVAPPLQDDFGYGCGEIDPDRLQAAAVSAGAVPSEVGEQGADQRHRDHGGGGDG